jgi:hypothetical protein
VVVRAVHGHERTPRDVLAVVCALASRMLTTPRAGPGPHVAVPVGSRVTVWAGSPYERTARVITTSHFDHPAGWSHLEIVLT